MYVISSDALQLATLGGRVLLAGTEATLDELRGTLALLPEKARGQVFVEVPSASDILPLAAPSRMVVTWLTRDTRSGEPGTCLPCERGQALRRAVRAWVGEMSTDSEHDDDDAIRVWFAGDTYREVSAV
ncbi:SIP domain-containing protein [Cnuibacter sp. UC19_7]|uniref:SIP domain-containing protein n=1 Tax=Cnuibacter sp. UC19_7 TaxID=3350166 RepID=UPI00366ADBE7